MAMIQDGIKYFSEFSPFLGYFMMFISVMIAVPLGEELLFRRMMINRLSKAYSIWIAIFLSSLLFGAIHIIAGGLVLGLGAFMMGLILGFIYEFSGQNFIFVVVAHAVANSADLILMGIKNNLFLPLSIILLMICLLSLRYIFIHAVKVTKN